MGFRMGLWLFTTIALIAAMYFWHKKRSEIPEQAGSSEAFSNLTLYFDPFKGEGHLFVGGTLVMASFSLFMYEFSKIIVNLFV